MIAKTCNSELEIVTKRGIERHYPKDATKGQVLPKNLSTQQSLEEPAILELPENAAHEASSNESAAHMIAPEPESRYNLLFVCLMALIVVVCVDPWICVCLAVAMQAAMLPRVQE